MNIQDICNCINELRNTPVPPLISPSDEEKDTFNKLWDLWEAGEFGDIPLEKFLYKCGLI